MASLTIYIYMQKVLYQGLNILKSDVWCFFSHKIYNKILLCQSNIFTGKEI